VLLLVALADALYRPPLSDVVDPSLLPL